MKSPPPLAATFLPILDETGIRRQDNALIKKFTTAATFEEQKECLDRLLKINDELDKDHKKHFLRAMVNLYIACAPRHEIQKSIYRKFIKQINSKEQVTLFDKCIQQNVYIIKRRLVLELSDKYFQHLTVISELTEVSEAITSLYQCLMSFAIAYLEKYIKKFCQSYMDNLVDDTKWSSFVPNVCRFLVMLLPKGNVKQLENSLKTSLLSCCYSLILHDESTFDTQNNCAYIIVLILSSYTAEQSKDAFIQGYAHLDLVRLNEEECQFLERVSIKAIMDFHLARIFKVVSYLGIINVTSPVTQLLDFKIHDVSVAQNIFEDLCQFSQEGMKGADFSRGLLRGISSILSLIFQFENSIECVRKLLFVMTIYSDIKDESIRQYVRQILNELIHKGKEHPQCLKEVFLWVSELPVTSIRYTTLIVLCQVGGANYLLNLYGNICKKLLEDVVNCPKPQMIIDCIEVLMQKHYIESTVEQWMSYWVDEIMNVLREEEHLPFTKLYTQLLVIAFRINPNVIKKCIEKKLQFETDAELIAFLECIVCAKIEKLQDDPEYKVILAPIVDRLLFSGGLDSPLAQLSTYHNDAVRLLIMKYIVKSSSKNDDYLEWECILLMKIIEDNLGTSDLLTRNEVISLTKQAVMRLESSWDNARAIHFQDAGFLQRLNSYYYQFRNFLMTSTLLTGIRLDCSYARRNACLNVLVFLSEQTYFSLYSPFIYSKDIDTLVEVVDEDSYEENKIRAAKILQLCPTKLAEKHHYRIERVGTLVRKSFRMCEMSNPTSSLAAALSLQLAIQWGGQYDDVIKVLLAQVHNIPLPETFKEENSTFFTLYCLVSKLFQCTAILEEDLILAAMRYPVHGYLLCIRTLLKNEDFGLEKKSSEWSTVLSDIIQYCIKISDAIGRKVLHKNAPEGFIPDKDVGQTRYMGKELENKRLLSQKINTYSWRAAKEIFLIMGTICSKCAISNDNKGLISTSQVIEAGNYIFQELLRIKHKGAFEQASVGFSMICEVAWNNVFLEETALSWINKTLKGIEIEQKSQSGTRRSAAIPCIVQVLLSTTSDNKHFQRVVNTLLDVVDKQSKTTNLHKVHALNILKALFRSNDLQKRAKPVLSRAVIASLVNFRSTCWSVKNSATQLFSVLMIKIFGVEISQDKDYLPFTYHNKMTAKIFLAHYTPLYVFMCQELQTSVKNIHDPILYPILLIFNQLFSYTECSEAIMRNDLVKITNFHLRHPVYRIRDLAAKISIQLQHHHKLPDFLVSCFIRLTDTRISDSYAHGVLLQLKYLLDITRTLQVTLNVLKIIDATGWILVCCSTHISHMTGSAYLDVLMRLLLKYDLKLANCAVFNQVMLILQWHMDLDSVQDVITVGTKQFRTYLFILKMYMYVHAINCSECDKKWGNIFSNFEILVPDMKKHKYLQYTCLQYVHYLNLHKRDFDVYIKYEESQNLYMQPLVNLIALSPSFLHPIHYTLFRTFIILLTKEDSTRALSVTRKCFNELIVFYNFPSYVKLKQESLRIRNCLLFKHYLACCKLSDVRSVCHGLVNLSEFLTTLSDPELKHLNLSLLIDVLYELSSPSQDALVRYGVSKLLVENMRLFMRSDWIFKFKDMSKLWITIFTLLEDEDDDTRRMICEVYQVRVQAEQVKNKSFLPEIMIYTPECTRDFLIRTIRCKMPTECSISILLSLILRPHCVTSENNPEVLFESDASPYAEIYIVAQSAILALRNIFKTAKNFLLLTRKRMIHIPEPNLAVAVVLFIGFHKETVSFIDPALANFMRHISTCIACRLAESNEDSIVSLSLLLKGYYLEKLLEELNSSEKSRVWLLMNSIFELGPLAVNHIITPSLFYPNGQVVTVVSS